MAKSIKVKADKNINTPNATKTEIPAADAKAAEMMGPHFNPGPAPRGEEETRSASEVAKQIKDKAKQSDQFEYEDADFAQEIFDKLPKGEFTLNKGNLSVIQKL